MTKNFNSNTTNNDEWLTPPYIIKELGEFDLDPCSPHPDKRPWDTAKNHYHKWMDGLSRDWQGRVGVTLLTVGKLLNGWKNFMTTAMVLL